MTNPWIATLTAILIWWVSTGAILWRVKRADQGGPNAHLTSVVAGLPLLALGTWGLASTLHDTTVTGTYTAFLAALAVWGWIELAFLSGIITGPNTTPCPPHATQTDRFLRATLTIAWHEMALIAALLLLTAASRDAANTIGLWTFAILFFARLSAKLNLFFGVPRIHTEFLPKPLGHLASHFRHARMNWVFPISVTALSFAAGVFIDRSLTATTDATLIGQVLLAALTLLALLEHWFMVLPLPDQKLWRWLLPATSDTTLLPRK